MPVRVLPPRPSLEHLKHQARDLRRDHELRDSQAAQRIREFHPKFRKATDPEIFAGRFALSDAHLTIARESGFPSWARLKRHIEKPTAVDDLSLPSHERIEDPAFRRAVDLMDAGEVAALRRHLQEYPQLIHQRVLLEGGNYFRNPALIEFIAENPIRRGTLPPNITEVTAVLLEEGAHNNADALNGALELVCSGCVPRQCGVQAPLIDLLCRYGADPNPAMRAAIAHGEFAAADALLRKGAKVDLPVTAALGRVEECGRQLPKAESEDRHRAMALAAQFGHTLIVRMLLDSGEDPNRYNPVGNHCHSTPLHQAALGGHTGVVRLLVERGARLDMKDTLWQGTPAGWARHAGNLEIEKYLRGEEAKRAQEG